MYLTFNEINLIFSISETQRAICLIMLKILFCMNVLKSNYDEQYLLCFKVLRLIQQPVKNKYSDEEIPKSNCSLTPALDGCLCNYNHTIKFQIYSRYGLCPSHLLFLSKKIIFFKDIEGIVSKFRPQFCLIFTIIQFGWNYKASFWQN